MARAIAHAIRDKATLLIDAPTGVGKSLAALVPVAYDVLDDGPQAAYATATIALQEQLTRKDIPIVQQALGGPTAAIMKGMNRYACLLKWAGERDQLDIGTRGTTYDVFAEWIETTQEGDSGELAPLPPFWSQIAASSDDCLGAKCSYRDDCFALRAARKAAESQLVVLNHHLLLFHARYRKTGELPATWVVDEAHKFPGIAAEVFGGVLSERALDGLLRRVHGLIEDRWHPLHTAARHAADEHDTFMARFVVAPGEAQELRVSATDLSRYRNALTLLDSVLSGVSDDAGREVGGVPFKDRRSMARKALTGYITTVDDVFTAGGAHARWVEVQGARRVFKSVPIDTGPVLLIFV
jgi:Rad3-related DNA helicase